MFCSFYALVLHLHLPSLCCDVMMNLQGDGCMTLRADSVGWMMLWLLFLFNRTETSSFSVALQD